MRLTLCLAFAAVVLLVPLPRAEACGGPMPCIEPARTAPAEGAAIPANAPGVLVLPRNVFGPTVRDAGISLHDADGGELAHTLELEDRGFLIRPSSPFEEGATYLLRFGEICDIPSPLPVDGGPPFEVPITVGPEAPLPTSIGELKLLETKQVNFGMFDSCGGPEGINMIAWFGIAPSPELAPWLPLTRFVLKVDGAEWAILSTGFLTPDGRMDPGPNPFLGPKISQVHARCPVQPDGGFSLNSNRGVRVGRHTARLEAFIAGIDASISAPPVEFSLVCDGGFDFGDGPGPLDPRDDLDATGCGCGASGAGGAASLMLLGLLGTRRRWWRRA